MLRFIVIPFLNKHNRDALYFAGAILRYLAPVSRRQRPEADNVHGLTSHHHSRREFQGFDRASTMRT
jgi:hypothetical protein